MIMQQNNQQKIIAYVQFITYLNLHTEQRLATKEDNYFLYDFMSRNADFFEESPNVYKFFGIRDSRRNKKRIMLPCYSTEKIIDEHFSSFTNSWSIREHESEEEMAYLVDKKVDFERFIISHDLRPQLKSLTCGKPITVNLYTQFVYNNILLEERDYFDNIINALCKGSRPEFQKVLNNIHNGDSAPSEHEMQMLIDAEVPYLIEYSDYIKTSVFNTVKELIEDLKNPDIDCSDEQYKQLVTETLLHSVKLSINDSCFQIMEVGIALDFPHNADSGGCWYIANDGVHIFIGSKDTKRQGFIIINKIYSSDKNFECEGAENVCTFVHYLMNKSLNEGLLDIKLIPFNAQDSLNGQYINKVGDSGIDTK